MPLYEYECDSCGQRFEVIQKFSDAPVETCNSCGKGPVRRLFSSPAIQFKGSGWYITDYAQKGKSDTSSAGSGTDDKKGKSDAGDKAATTSKTETTDKPAAKTESTSDKSTKSS